MLPFSDVSTSLAPIALPFVLADLAASTLLAPIAYPPVLTDACPSTFLAPTALPPVFAFAHLLVMPRLNAAGLDDASLDRKNIELLSRGKQVQSDESQADAELKNDDDARLVAVWHMGGTRRQRERRRGRSSRSERNEKKIDLLDRGMAMGKDQPDVVARVMKPDCLQGRSGDVWNTCSSQPQMCYHQQ